MIQNSKPEPEVIPWKNLTAREKGMRIIEKTEMAMLFLAALAVGMHLTYLLAIFDEGMSAKIFLLTSLCIDIIFVIDILFKSFVLGKEYLKSPWFVIDFLSTIPVLATFVESVEMFEGLRTMRWLRFFRFFRGLKALRAMKAMRALRFLTQMPESIKKNQKFEKALKYGVLGFACVFMILIVTTNYVKMENFETQIRARIETLADASLIPDMQGYVPPDQLMISKTYIVIEKEAGGISYHFSADRVEREMKVIEFWILIGIIMGVGFCLFLTHYQQKDSTLQIAYSLLNVFLPEELIRIFLEDPDRFYQQEVSEVTVMFIDIRGFTSVFEKFKEFPRRINLNLKRVLDIIIEQMKAEDLIVDKIIGDAALVFSGGPLVDRTPKENADRVVRAAVNAIHAVEAEDNEFFNKIKIGISTGLGLVGAGGSTYRLSYTVLGDKVNLAARLEPASGKLHTRMLIDEQTFLYIKDNKDYSFRYVGRMLVSGKEETVRVYEVLGPKDHGEWIALYESGIKMREQRLWEDAIQHFKKADEARPGGDLTSLSLIENCRRLSKRNIQKDWDQSIEHIK